MAALAASSAREAVVEGGDTRFTEVFGPIEAARRRAYQAVNAELDSLYYYEAYRTNRKVSALLRQLPWTHHLIILGQARPAAAREFYILAAIKERWSTGIRASRYCSTRSSWDCRCRGPTRTAKDTR